MVGVDQASGKFSRRILPNEYGLLYGRLAFELRFVISNQNADEHLGIDPDRQRESCSIASAFLPRLRGLPATVIALLFFTRINTVPTGISVNVVWLRAFISRSSQILLGIVVCPLLDTFESVFMGVLSGPYYMLSISKLAFSAMAADKSIG